MRLKRTENKTQRKRSIHICTIKRRKNETSLKVHVQSSKILAMSYYEFLITTNDLERWSPMERPFLFYLSTPLTSSFSPSPLPPLSITPSVLSFVSYQEKHHLSSLPHFLKLPVGCPVWSALPAWLFRFCIAKCLCLLWFLFLDRFHACRPIGFSSRFA